MAFSEIDSFVEKFKYLWHARIKASLDVESFDGKKEEKRLGLRLLSENPYQMQMSITMNALAGEAIEDNEVSKKAEDALKFC